MHISILLSEDAIAASIANTLETFRQANRLHHKLEGGSNSPFKVVLLSASTEASQDRSQVSFQADHTLAQAPKTDLIIVPAVAGSIRQTLSRNTSLSNHLSEQIKSGVKVVALGTGAILAAATGLLNGKVATTHWHELNEIQTYFPSVKFETGMTWVTGGEITTTAGGTGIDPILIHLIEEKLGKPFAVQLCKMLLIEYNLDSINHLSGFDPNRRHLDQVVLQIQDFVEENYRDLPPITEIAEQFGVGKRNLIRRFNAAVGYPPIEYVQRVKVDGARIALETGTANANNVMQYVGYTDPKSFRNLFKRLVGLTPVEYERRYRKDTSSTQ